MKTARIFQNDEYQTIQFPKDVHVQGSRVYIKNIGNIIVLIPEDNPWQALFDSLDLFTDDYMEERAQPYKQEREELFA